MAKDLWIIDYPDGSRDIIEPSFDTHVDPVTHAIIATYAEKTQHFPPRYPMDVSSPGPDQLRGRSAGEN